MTQRGNKFWSDAERRQSEEDDDDEMMRMTRLTEDEKMIL